MAAAPGESIGFSARATPLPPPFEPPRPSTRERHRLRAGDPFVVTTRGAGGARMGYVEVVLPIDPVTAFDVITDVQHMSLQDPAFPVSGPLTDRRHVFMPQVFDAATCTKNGVTHTYRLLVPPLIDPRVESVVRSVDQSAFPWVSSWHAVPELVCAEQRDPALEPYFEEAVRITRDTGAWIIGPVPAALRTADMDADHAHVVFHLDLDLGGFVTALGPAVGSALGDTLTDLVDQVEFHARHWRQHLRRYHPPEDLQRYERRLERYRARFGG